MADDAASTNAQPEKNSEAPKMPQIQIMPIPEPLKVNLGSTETPNAEAPAVEAPVPSIEIKPEPNEPTLTKIDEKSEEGKPEVKKDVDPEKNVFTQLFGDDKVMQSADLMGSVNKQGDRSKLSSFKEKLSLKSIKEKQEAKSGKTPVGKILLRVSVLLLIVTGGFFYTQNKASFGLFGANPAQDAFVAQEQLIEVESEVIVQKHLSAVLLLDQFVGMIDSYLYNLGQAESDVNSSNKKADFAETAEEDKAAAVSLLAELQDKVDSEITPDQKVAANTLVSSLIDALESKQGEVDADSLAQDIQDLQNARSLIQNDAFRAHLITVNLEEVAEEELASLLEEYNDLNKSTYAVIGSIRDSRMEWSQYFDEIETLTKKVDPLFNTEFTGNLLISNIRFDGGKITISGETSTDDTKNFTLVSNYIDTLESSSSFRNVEDRSYSKNAAEEDYTGQFRISLELENE